MMEADSNEQSMDLGMVRPGKSSRGSKTVDMILRAAVQVLIEEGSAAFTLKRIAEKCDLQIGNVTRHFPRKEMLVQLLLHEILDSGEELLRHRVYETNMPAEEALTLVITGTMEGAKAKGTTHLMTELWAMSNHNEFVAERVEALYQYTHTLIGSFVQQMNPSLDNEEVEAVSIFINAAMEGMTVIAGHGKPWATKMPLMQIIGANSLVQMAKTITSAEIRMLNARPDGMAAEKRRKTQKRAPK
jgi:AcrR family transcriptional regulator